MTPLLHRCCQWLRAGRSPRAEPTGRFGAVSRLSLGVDRRGPCRTRVGAPRRTRCPDGSGWRGSATSPSIRSSGRPPPAMPPDRRGFGQAAARSLGGVVKRGLCSNPGPRAAVPFPGVIQVAVGATLPAAEQHDAVPRRVIRQQDGRHLGPGGPVELHVVPVVWPRPAEPPNATKRLRRAS